MTNDNYDNVIILKKDDKIDKIFCMQDDILVNYYKMSSSRKEKQNLKLIKKLCKYIANLPTDNKIDTIKYIDCDDPNYVNLINELNSQILDEELDKKRRFECSYFLLSLLFLLESDIKNFGLLFSIFCDVNIAAAIFKNLSINIKDRKQHLYTRLRLFIYAFLITLNTYPLVNNPSQTKKAYQNIGDHLYNSLVSIENNFKYPNPFKNQINLSKEEAVEYLLDALKYNNNLTNEELDVALKLEEYLNTNSYINYKDLYDNFFNVHIENEKYIEDSGVVGLYNRNDNKITTYYKDDFNEEQRDYILFHEFVHMTGHIDNKCINEGMTQLLANEYFGESYITYTRETMLCKILCELIGSDKMLEAYTTNNEKIIINELNKIYLSENEGQQLLNLINKYTFNKSATDRKEFINKIYYLLRTFYIYKYHDGIYDDFVSEHNCRDYLECFLNGELDTKKYHYYSYPLGFEKKLERTR